MKKLLLLSLLTVLLISAVPPALPSSFSGYVSGGRVGQQINVWVGGSILTHTHMFLYNGQAVYSVNVPMDGVMEGAVATFKSGGRVYGSAALHSGTNVWMDLGISAKR